MKIQYDHQIFSFQKYGGVSRYFYELVNHFNNDKEVQAEVTLLMSNNYYLSNQEIIKYYNFFPNQNFKAKKRIITKINKMYSSFCLKKEDYDIFHPTYYDPYFLENIGSKPFVLTVHDMIHEKFSNYFNVNDNVTRNKKLLSEKASKIIAVSKHTKKDLIEIFNIQPSKIEVVYHGNSFINSKNIIKLETPNHYILFVGTRNGYKNFNSFISAVARLLTGDLGLSVVCAGGEKFNSEELLLFDKLNIIDKVFQYNLDDDALVSLYKQADLFVFPSLYEGFGIPILEAFSCGCPVVCSNTSSLPEIAGNGAHYFDPVDIDSILNIIIEVLGNEQLQRELIQNGRKRLEVFSWGKAAQETKKVYESIL